MNQPDDSVDSAHERALERKKRLDLSVAELRLTVRTVNSLEEVGIFTLRDLLSATPKSLLRISNFGERQLEEIYLALEKIGFYRPQRPYQKTNEKPNQEILDLYVEIGCAPAKLVEDLLRELTNLSVKLGGPLLRVESEDIREFDMANEAAP